MTIPNNFNFPWDGTIQFNNWWSGDTIYHSLVWEGFKAKKFNSELEFFLWLKKIGAIPITTGWHFID